MKLINEMLDNDIIRELAIEMDAVLKEYRNLILFTQLNEGVLSNLGNEVMQQVAEIQRRIEVIAKARNLVKRIEKSGGFSKEETRTHMSRLTKNRKSLSAALRRTSKKMKQFAKVAKKEIKKAADVENGSDTVPESNVDLRAYGSLAPFLLRQAMKGGIDFESEKFKAREETFKSLVDDGLLTPDGKITLSGEEAFEANKAKRGDVQKPTHSAIDDLANMDGENNLSSLSF